MDILKSFIPWIVYLCMISISTSYTLMASCIAIILQLIINKQYLKHKFILEVSSLIFFMFAAIAPFTPIWLYVSDYLMTLSNAAIAIIMLLSICVDKPFTIQYAKLEVPKYLWELPGFKLINYVITIVWMVALFIMTYVNYIQIHKQMITTIESYIYSIILIVLAILFTKYSPACFNAYKFHQLSKPLVDINANKFLQGNYAPIDHEVDNNNLHVEGSIPDDLDGVFMRNGPNPAYHPISYTYPFDGDGMVHALYINNGTACYKNRYVDTRGHQSEAKQKRALYGGLLKLIPTSPFLIGKHGDKGPIKNASNINVIHHAKRFFSLYEADVGYELNYDLTTKGIWHYQHDDKTLNANAHIRKDPDTGNLYMISYDVEEPYLSYYIFDKNGCLIENNAIEKAYPTMIHDFVITQDYIIFFDCPAVFDFSNIALHEPVIEWKPELGTTIILVDKESKQVTSYKTDPFWLYHFANAYEVDDKIIIDYVYHDKFNLTVSGESKPTLHRMTINTTNQMIANKQLLNNHVEFPRFNENMTGKYYRYAYMPTVIDKTTFNAVVKYDFETMTADILQLGDHIEMGEIIFIAKNDGGSEDDGFLMFYAYDSNLQTSKVWILSAKDIHNKPLAIIDLGTRVPHGLHGNWVHTDDL